MIVLQILAVFIFTFLFSNTGFAQTAGCIFLEGVELPCFGGGASCECGDYFSEEEINGACRGTLSPPVNGCSNHCGNACCDTYCSFWNPDEHGVCEKCVDCEKTVRGTIPLSCDDPGVIDAGKNHCGAFTYNSCGTHTVECQGTGVVQGDPRGKCLVYQGTPVSANRCGRRLVGASPNICNGSPTGAPECGGFPDSCTNTSSGGACLGATNECWTCSFTPGAPGTFEDYCAISSRLCIAEPPIEVNVIQVECGYTCPGGSIPIEDQPPYPDCDEVVSQCTSSGECPSSE